MSVERSFQSVDERAVIAPAGKHSPAPVENPLGPFRRSGHGAPEFSALSRRLGNTVECAHYQRMLKLSRHTVAEGEIRPNEKRVESGHGRDCIDRLHRLPVFYLQSEGAS
jgi:hypothetical protein